jgi:transposase
MTKNNLKKKSLVFQLSDNDYCYLIKTFSKGKSSARIQTRARVLDLLHRQESPTAIARILNITRMTVYRLKKRYLEEGLEAVLKDKPRSGKPPRITPKEKARITALACSDAPPGYARWTLRLLADKAVELGYVEGGISHNEVGKILKKTLCDRTNRSNGASDRSMASISPEWKMS